MNYKIPCSFDYAEVFIDGYARIRDSEKWGYIDTWGEIVMDPIYESLAYYYDDYAIFKQNNKFGYLDRNGDVAIDACSHVLAVCAYGSEQIRSYIHSHSA